MKIRYKYQPAPEDTTHYGVDFIGGVADVSDSELIAKFASHPHFEIEGEFDGDSQLKPFKGEGGDVFVATMGESEKSIFNDKYQYSDDRAALAAEYEEVFGKKPHHKMKAETIREALTNANDG